jgi:hypothetical protein
MPPPTELGRVGHLLTEGAVLEASAGLQRPAPARPMWLDEKESEEEDDALR